MSRKAIPEPGWIPESQGAASGQGGWTAVTWDPIAGYQEPPVRYSWHEDGERLIFEL